MFIRPWLEALKSRVVPGNRLNKRRVEDHSRLVQAQVEKLEDRSLLAAFSLVTVIPNQGVFLSNGDTLHTAPTEVTLRFSPGEQLTAASIGTVVTPGAITVFGAGQDGVFDDPDTIAKESTDDVPVAIGYIAQGDNLNEVIVRFASPLPDNIYQIRIQATASAGTTPLATTIGDTLTPDVGKTYKSFNFHLDLGTQVEAVVPQPVIRSQVFSPNAASIVDGDVVSVTVGAVTAKFELNVAPNNVTAGTNIRVDVPASATAAQITTALASAINTKFGATVTLTGSGTGTLTLAGAAFEPLVTFTTTNGNAFVRGTGTLSQATNKVVVYFNKDQLDATSASDPKFYQLIDSTSNAVLLPSGVEYAYNTLTGLSVAVLTFPAALTTSTYNLKVGQSTEPNDSTVTAVQAGTVFNNQPFSTNSWLGEGVNTSANSSDVDYYKITTNVTGTISVTLKTNAPLDGTVMLLASDGTTVIMASAATGVGGTVNFTTGAQPAGTYYAKVTGNAGTTGGYNLNITTSLIAAISDDNSSFATATPLGDLGAGGLLVAGPTVKIEPQGAFVTMPQLPGGADEPGHRQIPSGAFTGFSGPEIDHGTGTDGLPSAPGPTLDLTYSFPATYGNGLFNQITDQQKDIIRTIYSLYSAEAGISVREVASGGQGIVVGDIRVNAPSLPANGAGGISGNPLIINSIFYANDNEFGGGFTGTALHEIGHTLGLGHSYDVPSVQGGGPTVGSVEPNFTEDNDIIHLLRAHPDNASDIDLYQFNVTQSGTLSAQTIAERLPTSSFLDTVLTLYKEDLAGNRTVVARNDDFYSKDSGIDIALDPGTYYLGVTAKGNENYDPSISNSGFGGRSDGAYQLQMNFTPSPASTSGMVNTTGQFLDGDHDGAAGGVYNAWFQVAPTIVVDKLAPAGGNGSLGTPFNTISAGLAAAGSGSIVRIVGNGGADGNAATIADNVPYLIGKDFNGSTLTDGATFQIPKNVTVMIDAGALLKLNKQVIDVGSSSPGIDRSHGALQVLGTPVNNVTLTSWRDDASGSIDDGVNGATSPADWGGIVFRKNSDTVSASDALPGGVFLDTVNHATIQYGGGQVSVDGVVPVTYDALDLETSRPTLTNNIIRFNSDNAISANPDSFKADDLRIGPDIHGNLVTQNSTNGLFIRVKTPLGGVSETLNVIARFDDTDITHIITQNLILNGRNAGALSTPVSARLMIDPGTVVKLAGARIETANGSSNLIAEGTAANPIHFTSQTDDRYGAGGTFDVKNDGNTAPAASDWSGIYVGQTSTASLDHVSISYAGGASEIAGSTDNFNAVEAFQANLRVTNSLFENNAGGAASTTRGGRLGNDNSTIFIRGSQPVLVDNVFRDNVGNVISINANSLQNVVKPDYGRSTGASASFSQFDDNYGPLVRLNEFANSATFSGSSTLGMNIRPEELTIESIWDDTDIAHVVRGLIASSEFHTYGGLTLQSSPTASLVVKLQGATAGFLATGDPLEISNRIGGTVDVIGQPNFPVILTSLADDSVSAGFQPNGFPQFDTNGNGPSVGSPGDWNSLSFDQFSNDTNVAIVNETEPGLTHGNDINGTIGAPQALGNLAPNLVSGDENRRLGFEVHGFISPDSPSDVDVYSFSANSGTEIWADIDFTSQRLDSMLELLDSSGNVLARSLNSQTEQTGATSLSGTLLNTVGGVAITPVAGISNSDLNPLVKDPTLGTDFYSSNFHDAGFRVVLPVTGGAPGTPTTYFLRVRSQPVAGQEAAAIPAGGNGLTSGAYQLQLRLKQVDDIPGSTVQYADIRYATNGVETHGLPTHSPLAGELAEPGNDNNQPGGSTYLGPLLQTDRNAFTVSGSLNALTDVDFYSFTVDYSQVQVIIPGPKFFPTTFDIDYADGLVRPDTVIAVYNANKDLIYIGRESDIADDQPAPGQGSDITDLTRGSLKTLDAFIGSVSLPAGVSGISETGGNGSGTPLPSGLTTYYVAVLSNGNLPAVLGATFNANASAASQLVRLEPVDSIQRVVEDHIGFTGYNSTKSPSPGSNVAPVAGALFNTSTAIALAANIRPFTLADVNLFISSGTTVSVVDPFNGKSNFSYNGNSSGLGIQDLDMRPDGRLFGVASNGNSGNFVEFDTGTGSFSTNNSDGISVPGQDSFQQNFGAPDAIAWHETGNNADNFDRIAYAIQSSDGYSVTRPPNASPPNTVYQEDPLLDPPIGGVVNASGITYIGPNTVSKLYRARPDSGSAAFSRDNFGAVGYITDGGATPTITTKTTGMQYFNGVLYGVDSAGDFFSIADNNSVNTGSGNPDDDITDNLAPSGYPSTLATVITSAATFHGGGGRLAAGEGFVGLTQPPANVEGGKYANWLFALTSLGNIVAIDPASPTTQHLIFLKNGVPGTTAGLTDKLAITGAAGATGLAFSPVDFNLWHPTENRANDPGHGVNSTFNAAQTSTIDNTRTPGTETVKSTFGSETLDTTQSHGGASLYFGVENYASGTSGNYYQYQSGGQLGVVSSASQQDLTGGTSSIHNNYNVPGGTAGSLVTNSFNLEGYVSTDKPTLYFNYFLSTEQAAGNTPNSMRDAARVYVSTDNGQSWSLVATNNSMLSTAGMADAELPAFASASKSASANSNQAVQELFDTGSWRQERVDLGAFVGNSQVKLRFDFSTSGRAGTVTDPATGLKVASDNITDPTYVDSKGGSNGISSTPGGGASNNNFEGFYVDDIIVGFAGRGEMVTGALDQGSAFVTTPTDPDPNRVRPLLTGNYQLEIRRGEQYGVLVDPPTPNGYLTINPTLTINDRQTNGQTIMVGNTTQDGNTVTVYDGIVTKVFEFNSVGGVAAGNILVDITGLNPATQRGTIAGRLAIAINNAFAARKTVIASAVGAGVNSDRVDIFGAASVKALGSIPATINLGSENDNIGFGNDYPITPIANSLGGLTSGTNGVYTFTGTLGNSPQAGHPDSDFFQLNMSAGETVTFALTPTAITGTNYLIGVLQGQNPVALASSGTLTYTAPSAGTYFFGILGDDGNSTTSPFNPAFAAPGDSLASAGNDTFTYIVNATVQLAGTTLPAALSVSSYVRQGDDNLTRTQGQFIIQGNQILHSLQAGVLIDDLDRTGNVPNPGAPINLPVLPPGGAPYLVPGMYIQNNVISGFGSTGIDIGGDNTSVAGVAVTPFVKVVNNTIIGNLQQVSPNLLAIGPANVTGAMQAITFSEVGRNIGDTNPVYNFASVPVLGNVTVSFGSYFKGQAATGGTLSTLSDSTPTGPLALDNTAPPTHIFNDPNNPTSPVLSGSPDLNGPISVLFSKPVAAVVLTGGIFDAANSVSIEAYDVNGKSLGIVSNSIPGIETFGLTTTAKTNTIAGISIYVTGNEVADFSIDNLKFGVATTINQPTGAGTGIAVHDNISATILNNAIVGTNQAITIGPASGSTVIDANLFQFNNAIVNAGSNNLQVGAGVQMFVDPRTNNYYPNPLSPLIDSARSSFNERSDYSAIANPIGIPDSPIIAPLTDRFGQTRAADPLESVFTGQPGLGENPTKDRGAVERIDVTGGNVVAITPQDNDGTGVDLDPTAETIWIDAKNPNNPPSLFNPLTTFTLQLLDGGIGINDLSVNKSDFLVLENGTPLIEGKDYIFTYNQNTNECIFTSVSTFKVDARYQIVIDNPTLGNPATPFSGITDYAGNLLQNNHNTPITPANPNIPAGSGFVSSQLYFTYVITNGQNDGPSALLNGTTLPVAPATATASVINEDASITFSAALGNAITVFDQDAYLAADGDPNTGAQGGRIRTTISIPNGLGTLSLAANATNNLVADSGAVTFTGSPVYQIVLDGRIDDINTALNGLKFTPTPDYPIGLPAATVNITIFTEDLGKFGPPAPGNTIPKTTTALLPVVINPVNDPPTLTASTPITILEDKATPTQIALTNITAGGGELQSLKVTVVSNNTTLIPAANLVVGYVTSADPVGTPQLTTGNIQFTSAANQFGTAIVTVTVTDPGLDGMFDGIGDISVSQDVTINVTAVNDAPLIAKPADQTSLEDITTMVPLTGISVGPFEYPGQTLTLTAVSDDQTLIPNSNISISYIQGDPVATLTYIPSANRNGGPVTITITATDSGGTLNGGSDTVITSFLVNVTPVNDAPTVTVPASATILEDSVSGMAPNPAGSDIVLTGITTGPFEGSQTITSVTVTSSDQSIVPDSAIIQGTLSGGQLPLSITPLPNQFGPVTITVTVTDSGLNGPPNGDINVITKSFILNVLPVNDAPSFNLVPTQTIFEDAPLQTFVLTGLSAGPANESGQTLTLSAVSLTPGLIPDPTVVGNNTLMYQPVANANGTAQILVTLKDNGNTGTTGDSDTYQQIITINVTAVNDPPTLNPIANQPQSGLLLEDAGQQTVNLTGITAGPADESGQNVTITAAITSGNLNLVNNLVASSVSGSGTATLNYTPVANENGIATVTVTVTDNGANGTNGNVNSFTRTFTITVTPVDDAPSFDVVLPQTVLEDAGQQTLVLTGVVQGPANESSQALVLSAISLTPNLVSDPTVVGSNTLKYTTLPDANGQAVIRVTLKDNGGTANGGFDTYTQDIIINITPVNDAPTLNTIPNQPATGLLLEDSGQQTVNLSGITAGPADENTQSLVVSAAVTGGNPNLLNNLITSAVSGTGTATLNYTPVANEFGTATISVTVTDNGPNGVNGAVNFITKTFTITVTPVNDAPSFDPVFPITILEDAPQQVISLTGLSTGPANESSQTLILSAVSLNPNLIGNPTVVGNDTLKFTPVANAVGTATIRVTMKDNGGISNGGIDTFTQDIVVNITPVNDAPTLDPINAVPSSGLLLEDAGQQTVNLTGITAGPADESGQALSVSAVVTSGNLNLINNLFTTSVSGTGTATLKFIPTPNEFGTATVTVTVTDSGPNGGANGDVNFTTRTFTITVTPVNDQPTINALPDQVVNEDENNGQHTIQLTGISTGPLNEASQTFPTFSAVSSNPALIPNDLTHLSITYNPGDSTGQLNYTTVPNGFGTATITLTLKDSGGTANGGSDTIIRTFKITVNQVPDAPTSTSLSNSQVPENQPAGTLVGTFTTQDVDLPDDNFTYSIVGGTGQGVFQVNGNQLVTTQSLDFEPPALNSYTLTVRTTDKFGKTLDSTFNVIVLNLNDAPTLDPLSPVIFNEDPATPFLVNLSGITAGFGENQSLTVTATSDNPSLFDNPLPINYVSPNSTGTLQLSPKLNANGSATITVTVQDNGGTAGGGVNTVTRTFTVTVLPVNDNPTDINLSNNTIPEIAAGTAIPAHVLVGQLSSIDPDNPLAGDTFTYTLVSGTGSNDNLKFSIFNNQLFAEGPIDFDTQPDYTIRVRSTDSGAPNLSFDKVLTIHSTNVNEPATGISTAANPISGTPNSIPENQPAGSVVGSLVAADPDAGDSSTFSLVSGVGSDNNGLFQIINGQLVANASFDFETVNSYTVRIRSTDSHGLSFETPVTIHVTNVDEVSTDVNLSNNIVPEDIALGATVGLLSTVDVDNPEAFTYSLAAGAGSTDNGRFAIVGNKLVAASALNFEERPSHSYSVRVRSTDIGGLTFEKVFTVNVTDVNEAPTDLTLSPASINENLPAGSLVGTLIPIDQDLNDTYTYTFVNGAGSDDNSSFELNGSKLVSAVPFDFETKASYTVRVQATDGGGHQIERQFTIAINNEKDPPVIVLANSTLSTTGKKAVTIDTGATITDNDSPNFDGGKLKVYIQSGEQTGDTISFKNEKRVKGQLTLKTTHGKTVLVLGKQQIGTVSGGVRGIPLVIQFGTGISQELFQRVMRDITFKGKPFAAPRQLAMQAFDETGLASNIAIRNINVN